jgi:hypothetical protein
MQRALAGDVFIVASPARRTNMAYVFLVVDVRAAAARIS